jgi:predicted ATPase/transcriptional regulator with XRE-family HTH domain
MTQEQLASRAGISPDAVAALERGKRNMPRATTVEMLATALALSEAEREELLSAVRQFPVPSQAPLAGAHTGESTLPHQAGSFGQLSLAQPTPLVDRTEELGTIRTRLVAEGVRLLTLTGPAGVGKTRLALAAAIEVADAFPDGIVWIDLAPVRDPQQVVPAIAQAFAIVGADTRPLRDRLVEYLRERTVLLVLDNFEQVVSAASQVSDLLAAAPGLSALVTSRVPLHSRWEHILRIEPLPVPDLTALPSLDELMRIPAVELFVERARARRGDFVLTEARAPLVAQVVASLDGLPLALELAAARLDVLPLPALVSRLSNRLRLLEWAAYDLPERQRSLEAAVGWSYDLLSAEEQRLFRHLGVLVGRASVEAIAAVLGEEDLQHVLDGLVSLAEKSLILRRRDEDVAEAENSVGEVAFDMLETVREYAQERLAASGELEVARRAHAHAFQSQAEQAGSQPCG